MGHDVAAHEDGSAPQLLPPDDSTRKEDGEQGVLGGVQERVEFVAFGEGQCLDKTAGPAAIPHKEHVLVAGIGFLPSGQQQRLQSFHTVSGRDFSEVLVCAGEGVQKAPRRQVRHTFHNPTQTVGKADQLAFV